MPDKNYTLNLRNGNVLTQLTDIFQDIFARKSLEQVETRLNKAIDREISKVFQRIAINIVQDDFATIQPYIPTPWPDYDFRYAQRKYKAKGHLHWFLYGKKNDTQLAAEFLNISPSQVLRTIGQTRARVSSDKKKIQISIAPNVAVTPNHMERQFYGVLSIQAENKLQNRRQAYRALLGPEFLFMLNERIPQLIERSIARF